MAERVSCLNVWLGHSLVSFRFITIKCRSQMLVFCLVLKQWYQICPTQLVHWRLCSEVWMFQISSTGSVSGAGISNEQSAAAAAAAVAAAAVTVAESESAHATSSITLPADEEELVKSFVGTCPKYSGEETRCMDKQRGALHSKHQCASRQREWRQYQPPLVEVSHRWRRRIAD